MKGNDLHRIHHVKDAALELLDLAERYNRDDLDSNRMLMLATIKLIEIMGEAANKVSMEFRGNNPELPWKEMIRMRNRLIHGYDTVDLNVIWDTVEKNAPAILKAVEQILGRAEKSN